MKPEKLDEARITLVEIGVKNNHWRRTTSWGGDRKRAVQVKYVDEAIDKRVKDEVSLISHIAITGINGIENNLQPLKHFLRHQFISAITGGNFVNDVERSLLFLPSFFSETLVSKT